MKRVHVILTLLVLGLGLLQPAVTAQETEGGARSSRTGRVERQPKQEGRDREEMLLRRERWNQKSDAERQVLRKRFRKLQELSPEKRRELEDRARQFERMQKSLRETAPEELKRELSSLEPDRRERRWREHMDKRSRDMGRHLRESMPPELRERLENASPEERHRLMDNYMRTNEDMSRRAVHGMGRMLGLPREQIRHIEDLPQEERIVEVLKLKRRVMTERIDTHGLPPGIDEDMWARMQSMPDEEFLRHLRAASFGGREGGPWRPWERGRRREGGRRGERSEERPHKRPDGRRGPPGERRGDFPRNRYRGGRF